MHDMGNISTLRGMLDENPTKDFVKLARLIRSHDTLMSLEKTAEVSNKLLARESEILEEFYKLAFLGSALRLGGQAWKGLSGAMSGARAGYRSAKGMGVPNMLHRTAAGARRGASAGTKSGPTINMGMRSGGPVHNPHNLPAVIQPQMARPMPGPSNIRYLGNKPGAVAAPGRDWRGTVKRLAPYAGASLIGGSVGASLTGNSQPPPPQRYPQYKYGEEATPEDVALSFYKAGSRLSSLYKNDVEETLQKLAAVGALNTKLKAAINSGDLSTSAVEDAYKMAAENNRHHIELLKSLVKEANTDMAGQEIDQADLGSSPAVSTASGAINAHEDNTSNRIWRDEFNGTKPGSLPPTSAANRRSYT